MMTTRIRAGTFAAGLLWAVAAGAPALADDTELFLGNNTDSQAQPNILFVIDNSISMQALGPALPPYDPLRDYSDSGTCVPDRVYYRSGEGTAPACSVNQWFNPAALKCNAASVALASVGYYAGRMAQYDSTGTASGDRRWETFNEGQRDWTVECAADNGTHGDGVTTNRFPRNGTSSNGYWGTSSNAVFGTNTGRWSTSSNTNTYTLYTGNYLNYRNSTPIDASRLDVVKYVTKTVLDTVDGVNVGLMHFNENPDNGGRVAYAMEDIATARPRMKEAIDDLDADAATPLSETLYEAGLYYTGRNLAYGTTSDPASRVGTTNQYDTPIDYPCQRNFVVVLTDGAPYTDSSADNLIKSMADADDLPSDADEQPQTFSQLVGAACDVETYPAGTPNPFDGDGPNCLDDLAEFLHDGDLSPLDGQQNLTTYTVGFTIDLPLLAHTADRGGGDYFQATDTVSLADALNNIVTSIISTDQSFTAPTVAVNAFNRTQNLSDLFVSVFRPAAEMHWAGNLKKYRLRATDAEIVDANGDPAIDPATGFFHEDSQSYWSATVDGASVEDGGAASLIPAPASRKVYTQISGNDLTATINRVAKTNNDLLATHLGVTAATPTRDQVIDFINGVDLPDTNQNNNTTEARNQMGDPLHAQPVTVVYGPDIRDGLIFFATNDGFLHALDLETGVEQWAFIPPDFLNDQAELYQNDPVATKYYGIDGNLRVQMLADNDGIIESGEKVYLFFGMRRGGKSYYGLDVTNPAAPQVLWNIGTATLPGLGESWSTPVPTRIRVQGATQNANHLALVIGGGYEADQDNAGGSTDTEGNSIYIVDSVSGALLWHGSRDGRDKDFNEADKAMDYSIPGDITVIDLDGDRYADRMYAGDMGGQVWRFDITNGALPADLIAGGVLAQFGGAPAATPPVDSVRRFYSAPDVAIVNNSRHSFIHVGIGSGHRAHPLSTLNNDRFYALRDYGITKKNQDQFDDITPLTDADMEPLTEADTDVPDDAAGWKLDLQDGEKVLAEARTFADEVYFTTFRPGTSVSSCQPGLGTNRLYRMSLFDGAPVTNLDGVVDDTLTLTDRYVEAVGGILPTPQLIFTSDDQDGDGIPDDIDTDRDGDSVPDDVDDDVPEVCEGEDCGGTVVCVGMMCFPPGFTNTPVRTYWFQESVDD
jgi:type IV pilus assembly protein PilY1